MKFFRTFFAIALFLPVMALQAQEKVNLAFRFQPGVTYRYKTTDTFNTQQEMYGQDVKISGGNTSRYLIECLSVAPDSSMTLVTMYEEMSTHIKSAVMDTVMDHKENTGKRAKVVLSRWGREMGRELMDSANVAGSKAPMAFSQSVGFFELPGHPVSFGEKWNAETIDSTAVGEGFTAKIAAIEYTLTGTEPKNGHDCLKIEFTSKNEMTGKMKQMGMDVFIEGTGDTKGTIWFDAKAGLMILRESATVQDITYAMSGSMTMTIPMTQSIKSSHSLVE